MTLAVARRRGGGAVIVVDTLLTDKVSDLRRPEFGMKLFSVGANTLIAYAGDDLAGRTLITRAASDPPDSDSAAVIEQMAARADGIAVDFIALSHGKISEYKNGNVKHDVTISHIGNQDAFEVFQEHFLEGVSAGAWVGAHLKIVRMDEWTIADTNFAMRMHEALVQTNVDKRAWTVGGSAIVGSSTELGSGYLGLSGAHTPPIGGPHLPGWHTIEFEGASGGGCMFTTITPKNGRTNAWGEFFHQAQWGRLFYVDLNANLFEVWEGRAENAQAFCDAIAQDVGIEVVHCGSWSRAAAS